MRELYKRLMQDFNTLDAENKDVELILRPYSKTMYGYYDPRKRRIVLYIYLDCGKSHLRPYSELWDTFLHELAHHLQYTTTNYVRTKGVMHNSGFYKILDSLKIKSNTLKLGGTH